MGVPPNGTFGYVWSLTSDDGPLKGDPQCLTQLYQSTVSPERDLASGLVGTLLICKYEALDTKGRLVRRTIHLCIDEYAHAANIALVDTLLYTVHAEALRRDNMREYASCDAVFLLHLCHLISSVSSIMLVACSWDQIKTGA